MVRSRVADFPASTLAVPRPTWDEAVRTFLEACRVSGQSTTSVQSKADSVSLFTRHCAALDCDPWEAGTDFIQGWLAGQRNHLARNTVRLRLLSLRVLYRYLCRRGWLDGDPTEAIPTPQQAFTPVQPYADADLQAMWRNLDGCGRDAAILAALLGGSLRASEVCALRVEDIDFGEGIVRVYGKGGKWRLCAPGPIAMRRISAYIGDRQEGPVFLGLRGPLTRNGVWSVVSKLGRRAGVVGARPHRFRHTFGDRFLEAGGSASDLQSIFGHSSSQVTRQYVAANAQRRAVRAQRQYNPMAIMLAVSEGRVDA